MMRMRAVGAGSFLILGLVLASASGQSDEKRVSIASVVKPRPEEIRWQKVPWIVDLAEGQRVARAEGRPLFLWATAGTLDRC
jgi:hypothetical protein